MKIDQLKNLKKHLKTQIRTANSMGSKWVYILTTEAEKCLELAEKEDLTVVMERTEPGRVYAPGASGGSRN